ncbi:efflux RND transporter periplasmic adaptor subunit [Hydrogenovibrio halophilus]|uniref:efflux RND transporter periplasmic adaptor subunit n=1 Tax=Hydrogenovibrio halophilus TaxID=373391 RepID=UPI00037AE8F7|nr:efflux RND transporter periplasmic adaptor subunit [Hydrogenovibrio halophilus]
MKTHAYSLKTPLLVALLTLGLAGCGGESASETANETVQTIQAPVATVKLGSIPLQSVVPGSVVPDQKGRISSRLMGYIKDLEVKVGDRVDAGDLLFSIDSNDVSAQITQAESGYQQAQAALEDAKLDYDRFKKLYAQDSVSKQQFDKISLQYRVAQENLAAARSAYNQAQSQLNYVNVKAPFDGVVVEKMAVAGDMAAPGNPVLVLENLQSLSVQTQVSEDIFAVLRQGDKAEIKLDGKVSPFYGEVYTLVSAADPRTRTHTVKLSLPKNIGTVNSGTFARVGFTHGDRQAIMVPQTAVVNRSGIEGVFVVSEGKARFHMVRLGEEIDDKVEIKAGLQLGDTIVVDDNMSILNGDRIQTGAAQGEGA